MRFSIYTGLRFIILFITISAFLWTGCLNSDKITSTLKNDTSRKELDITHSKLSTVPLWIEDFKDLEKLNLFKNQISHIPSFIGELTNLEYLSFQSNRLDSISPDIGKLKNLKTLNLRFNNLKELPDEIGDLENLEELDLRNNKLIRLPKTIGKLKNLEVLRLNDNHLKELPSQIGMLENLKFLYIGKNDIQGGLPVAIAHLYSLVELDVSHSCTSTTLPTEWGQLKNLELIIVDPSINVPYEIGHGNRNFIIVVN